MYERLCSLFDEKNKFQSKQFGIFKNLITIDPLVEITEPIRQRSTDTFTCVLTGLRMAFDSINHEILLAKLKKVRVRGK